MNKRRNIWGPGASPQGSENPEGLEDREPTFPAPSRKPLGGALLAIRPASELPPDALEAFNRDHKKIVAALASARACAAQSRWEEARVQLSAFNVAVQGHAIKEGVRLYGPLRDHFFDDPKALEIFEAYRVEMAGLAARISDFAQSRRTLVASEALQRTFTRDLDVLGAALVERLAREEDYLFPMFELL